MITIKSRTTLVKALALAGITDYKISGQGKSLQVTVYSRRDSIMFSRKAAKWPSVSNDHSTRFMMVAPYRPGSEHDFCNVASHHHY